MKVGILGVGGVARYAHLPSYRDFGIEVGAVYDRDDRVAREVAREFSVPLVARDIGELCAHVDVVDIATPPATHVDLLGAVADAGKPVLLQKPACTTRADLDEIAALRDAGLRVRLNMTGRHVSAWRRVAAAVHDGVIGRPTLCTIVNRDWWDRDAGRWDHDIQQYVVFEMVIHHLDLCRFWFGPPARVAARTGAHPRQQLAQANWATVTLEYASGLVVQLVDDWTLPEFSFASGHPFESVTITGDAGAIRATSESVAIAPLGANRLDVFHRPRPGQHLPGDELTVGWFPDSFGASMRAFIDDLTAAAPDVATLDWDHLLALSTDAFTVAEAATSDSWRRFDP